MANSKYEYVKSFEIEDEVMYPNLIVVRIDGRIFERFSEINEFEKPNDERALNLMNSCATSVLEKYPDIIFTYGFSDEYSFIFKKETKFYQRRASKILSLIVSFFTSIYVEKWREFFPQKDLKSTPSFKSRIICCPSMEVLQSYLAWRQREFVVLEEFKDIVYSYGVSDEYRLLMDFFGVENQLLNMIQRFHVQHLLGADGLWQADDPNLIPLKVEKDSPKITDITKQSEESTNLISKLEGDIPNGPVQSTGAH